METTVKNMLATVQTNMGKNYVGENVFNSDCYMQSSQAIRMFKSKAQVVKRNVLKVHIIVRRKMPCPNTVFHKDKTQVPTVGRKLCLTCSNWGKLNDLKDVCSKCLHYLVPEGTIEADIAIAAMKCETPQWNQEVPFDPRSQIGGTITTTSTIAEAWQMSISHYRRDPSTTADIALCHINQIRAHFAVKLGHHPIMSEKVCATLRQLVTGREALIFDLLHKFSSTFESIGHRRNIGIAADLVLEEKRLTMTFKLYLLPNPTGLDLKPLKISDSDISTSGNWTAERAVIAHFLCADPTSSMAYLMSRTHFMQPPAIPAIPATASATAISKAATEKDVGVKGEGNTEKVDGSKTLGVASEEEGKGAWSATPTATATSTSTSTATPLTVVTATTAASVSTAGSETPPLLATPKPTLSVSATTTAFSTAISHLTSSSTSTSTPSSTPPSSPCSMDSMDSTPPSPCTKDALDSMSPVQDPWDPALYPYQLIKSSAKEVRLPNKYDQMDTTLSGLYRSMLVDGAAMLVKFHGINGDFPTNYSADYARRQSAQSSIPGFMQVSTFSIFASVFAAM